MSDPVTKDASQTMGQSVMLRAWHANVTKPGDKVVTFLSAAEGVGGPGDAGLGSDGSNALPIREWSAAVDLIQEASEAIRVGEQRVAELEVQLDHVTSQASEEMRRLSQQIILVEQKLARSEQRARFAEARASEAEAWLVRLHDAAVSAFGPKRTQEAAAAGNGASAPA